LPGFWAAPWVWPGHQASKMCLGCGLFRVFRSPCVSPGALRDKSLNRAGTRAISLLVHICPIFLNFKKKYSLDKYG
jgi:hypothetical protein